MLGDLELISQGAEARVFKTKFCGDDVILKERFQKSYRHPELDKKLTKSRMTQEVRCSTKALKVGVDTPAILNVDMKANKILMEYIDGLPLREVFDMKKEGENGEIIDESEFHIQLSHQLGEIIAQLHNSNIVHGDLTTSNVLLRKDSTKLVMIDFGLAKSNANVEDKAVDLYVLDRAFSSTHPKSEGLFQAVLDSYAKQSNDTKVIEKFRQVQLRGRKREMIG